MKRKIVALTIAVMTTSIIYSQEVLNITTLAGHPYVSGGGVAEYADGLGTAARFALPFGVAVDAADNAYVADTVNNCIRRITTNGMVTTWAGTNSAGDVDGPSFNARFRSPIGIAVDEVGNVYVADSGNEIIRKITPDGTVSTFAGYPGHSGYANGTGTHAMFNNPYYVAVDTAGNVYVTDRGNDVVREITPAGVVSTLAGKPGKSGYQDGVGTNALFNGLDGIAVDSAGNVYVSDSGNEVIREVTSTGVVSTIAGWQGHTGNADGIGDYAMFYTPVGLAIDTSGNLYVADSGNYTVRKITVEGTNFVVATIAGLAGSSGWQDGLGSIARFKTTCGIAVDAGGIVFISEAGSGLVIDYNNTIRTGIPYYPGNTNVSTTYSTLTVSPSWAPADGASSISATLNLRDVNDAPVVGQNIIWYSGSPVNFSASSTTTDSNGESTVTLTSRTPGTATIWAVQMQSPDNIGYSWQADVTFTPPTLVMPSTALGNEIIALYNDTANYLDGTVEGFNPSVTSVPISVVPIYWLAPSEGAIGDYSQGQATAAKAQSVMDAAFFGGGEILGGAIKDSDTILQLIAAEGGNALNTEADLGLQGYFDSIANSSSGCSTEAQGILNGGITDQENLQGQEWDLLGGIPQSGVSFENAYTNDLQSRLNANHVLMGIAAQQDGYLLVISNAWQVSHNPVLSIEQGGLEGIAIGAAQFVPVVDVGVDLLLIGYSEAQNYQSFTEAQNNYAFAQRSLLSCWGFTDEIYSNTAAGFSEIANGSAPNPVTGQIQNVSTTLLGYQSQVPLSWLTGQPSYVTAITNEYSTVDVRNLGANADFQVVALYYYSNQIYSLFPETCIGQAANVGEGQSTSVQLQYLNGNIGSPPNNGGSIQVYVLGINNTGIFYIGLTNFTVVSTQVPALLKTEQGTPLAGGASTSNTTEIIENPIVCQVTPNPSNQTYQAAIRISNPFVLPLTATVTQPIPSGMSIVATSGTTKNSSIVWTNVITPSNIVVDTFTFNLSVIPGAQTNLPPPSVIFTDNTGTNNASFQAVAPVFAGLLPVQVTSFIPSGQTGINVSMQLAVTNWAGTSQTGNLTISLSNSGGVQITNFSLAFTVNGLGSTNLIFSLPGNLSAGSYLLTIDLGMDGGTEQVLSGFYIIPQISLTLGVGSQTYPGTNGFPLMLTGPIGSNYVIEASTDLVSWPPIAILTSTNSPFYFTDWSVTNVSYRFYRALIP